MIHGRLGSFLLHLSVNIGLLLLGLTALELMFGNWFVSYVLPNPKLFDRKFTFQQTLYEPRSTVTYVRDKYGLRGLQQPISSVKLVTIGGSTTAQSFITEGETWQDVIHSLTGILIANAGVDGMGSQSHAEILEDWLHRIPGLHAKYFLHYLGVNDAPMAQTVSVTDRRKKYSWTRRIRARSAILQAISRIREWVEGPSFVSHSVVTPDTARGNELIKAEVDRADIVDYVEKMYKPNLRNLLDLHQQYGKTAIFVTQPANPALVVRKDGDVFVTKPEIARWAVALGEINAATETVCHERPGNCRFIDLANGIPFEPSDFYDLVHNTPRGARKVGAFLAHKLDLDAASLLPQESAPLQDSVSVPPRP